MGYNRCCAPTTAVCLSCNKISAVAEVGDRLATVDMGRKLGGCCAPFRGGQLGPHLTVLPRLRPTSAPIRDILIHPVVWSQYTNVTDRQTYRQTDMQDNGPVA